LLLTSIDMMRRHHPRAARDCNLAASRSMRGATITTLCIHQRHHLV
jgi:hypothetical protein